MIITAWILLICFGVFALNGFFKFFFGSGMNSFHAISWFISIVISALSAGVIWGKLFQ
ncbi:MULTISPECIES: hypothetical protein [Bacillus cereus group]|uniref:hypothetical protein n=1 Tax=Bacillus cereus group TaxID=86661 RepID=UPI000B1FF316|nr:MULTISPECIES: hypothetical protein [Bacillus cereus group]MDX6046706.1 hypothetical protein [Bacillus paranthracis]